MPTPSRLSAAVSSATPFTYADRLRSIVHATADDEESLVAPAESEDPDSDEEAEAILASFRARAKKKSQEMDMIKAAEEEALKSCVVEDFWGPLQRRTAIENAKRKIARAKDRVQLMLRFEALPKPPPDLLTDPDWLWLFMAYRERALLGALPTEQSLAAFASCGAVCRAWHDAVQPVTRRRCRLRHAHMVAATVCYPTLGLRFGDHRFKRPSFIETAPSGEIVVAEQHQLALLPSTRTSTVSYSATRTFVTPATHRILGTAGSAAGELYHPHGLAISQDGLRVYVADRSNHRVQCLRLADGAPLDATQPGAVWGPYGLALLATTLFVADANNDRIVGLDCHDLRLRRGEWGAGKGSTPGSGELDRPRGLATMREGAQLVVADMGNNRMSVFEISKGEHVRCFGDIDSGGGALPLRQPYGVVVLEHEEAPLVLVSEYDGRRIVVFSLEGAPLQIVSPAGVGALGGLVADEAWIYALDAEKGRLVAFTTRAPAPLGDVVSAVDDSRSCHDCTDPTTFLHSPVGALDVEGLRMAQARAAAGFASKFRGLRITAGALNGQADDDGSPGGVIDRAAEEDRKEREAAEARRRAEWLQLKRCMCTEQRCNLCLPL